MNWKSSTLGARSGILSWRGPLGLLALAKKITTTSAMPAAMALVALATAEAPLPTSM